jgi:argininosuccinate lyase
VSEGRQQGDGTDAGRLWGGRFTQGPAEAAWALGVSTSFDRHLWRQDLAGSAAHARQLHRIGVLDEDELERCSRRSSAAAAVRRDAFEFLPTDEDVHGAIERWLVEELGALGGKLRAGRSRNDQIASDLRLWCRDACDELVGLTASSRRRWWSRPRRTWTGSRPATPTCSAASPCCSATTCWPTCGCWTATPGGCATPGRG